MVIIVAAFALMIMSLSIYGIVNTAGLIGLVRGAANKAFMTLAVGSRVLLAMLLWFSAADARHPVAFQVLAIIALLGAFVLIAAGKERSLRLMDWWTKRSAAFQRPWLVVGLAFGAYLLWEVWPALAT